MNVLANLAIGAEVAKQLLGGGNLNPEIVQRVAEALRTDQSQYPTEQEVIKPGENGSEVVVSDEPSPAVDTIPRNTSRLLTEEGVEIDGKTVFFHLMTDKWGDYYLVASSGRALSSEELESNDDPVAEADRMEGVAVYQVDLTMENVEGYYDQTDVMWALTIISETDDFATLDGGTLLKLISISNTRAERIIYMRVGDHAIPIAKVPRYGLINIGSGFVRQKFDMSRDPEEIMEAIIDEVQELEIPFTEVPRGDNKTGKKFEKAVKKFEQGVSEEL